MPAHETSTEPAYLCTIPSCTAEATGRLVRVQERSSTAKSLDQHAKNLDNDQLFDDQGYDLKCEVGANE